MAHLVASCSPRPAAAAAAGWLGAAPEVRGRRAGASAALSPGRELGALPSSVQNVVRRSWSRFCPHIRLTLHIRLTQPRHHLPRFPFCPHSSKPTHSSVHIDKESETKRYHYNKTTSLGVHLMHVLHHAPQQIAVGQHRRGAPVAPRPLALHRRPRPSVLTQPPQLRSHVQPAYAFDPEGSYSEPSDEDLGWRWAAETRQPRACCVGLPTSALPSPALCPACLARSLTLTRPSPPLAGRTSAST